MKCINFLTLIVIFSPVLGITVFTSSDDPISKIVGGQLADIEDYPHQVSVRVNDNHVCGGSILDATTVVTAAHCMVHYLPKYYSIRVGNTDKNKGKQYKVQEVIVHPNYNKTIASDNDAAVLKISPPISFTQACKPIQLIAYGFHIPEGSFVTTLGWGTQKENDVDIPTLLRKVDIRVVSNTDCGKYYGVNRITKNMLCAMDRGKDSCQGDSGGPLIFEGSLCGIVSFGFGCARPGIAGVYASVATLRPWIESHMSTLSDKLGYEKINKGLISSGNKISLGGQDIDVRYHPYQASIRYFDKHICSGIILDPYTILTAAHCIHNYVKNYQEITIRVGNTDNRKGESYLIRKILIHPEFNNLFRFNNDVGILKVKRPLNFNLKCQPVHIVEKDDNIKDSKCTITGWGSKIDGALVTPHNLRRLSVQRLSPTECRKIRGVSITNNMLCSKKDENSCGGESGGPLICRKLLYGVVSFGNTCNEKGPTVYARISQLKSWIEKHFGLLSTSNICPEDAFLLPDYIKYTRKYYDLSKN